MFFLKNIKNARLFNIFSVIFAGQKTIDFPDIQP
jgi:hypothetical protein